MENVQMAEHDDYLWNKGIGGSSYADHKRITDEALARGATKKVSSPGTSGSQSSKGSPKGVIQFLLALLAFEAAMNFTGYLTTDFQRGTAFIGSISSIVFIHKYWDLIVKFVIGLILLAMVGSLGYNYFFGK